MGNRGPSIYNDEMYFDRKPEKVYESKMGNVPYRLIGLIIAKYTLTTDNLVTTEKVYGTGTLISPNLVLTVAHNIYWRDRDEQSKNIRFYLAQNGKLEQEKSYKVKSYYYDPRFKSENAPKYDIAIMKLETSTDEKHFMNVVQDVTSVEQIHQTDKVGIFGYVGKNVNRTAYLEGLISTGKDIIKLNRRLEQLLYRISTAEGQSGAVIILMRQNEYTIMGVHKGENVTEEQNAGVMFTTELIRNLQDQAASLRAIRFNINPMGSRTSYFNTAQFYRKKENWEKAQYWYRQFLSTGVVHYRANFNLALTLIERGRQSVHIRKIKYQEALEKAIEACNIAYNNDPKVLKLRAYILTLLGDLINSQNPLHQQKYQEALVFYERANEFEPQNGQTLLNIGTVLNYLKRYKHAKQWIEASEHFGGRTAQLCNSEGYYYFKTAQEPGGNHQFQKAINSFKEAIKLDPDQEEAHMNLGSVYQENEHFLQAMKQFNKVLEINPMNSHAYNNIGVCQFKQKQQSRARDHFLQAITLNPTQDISLINYVDTFTNQAEINQRLRELRERQEPGVRRQIASILETRRIQE